MEKPVQTNKEIALENLVNEYKRIFAGDNDAEESNDLENALVEAERLGASIYETEKARFLALPQSERQAWLLIQSSDLADDSSKSLEQRASYYLALAQIRDDFGLKDPHASK